LTATSLSVGDAPFGAKGDGTTDDTAAIQAAVNYAVANSMRLTFGGPGLIYRITSPITIPFTNQNFALDLDGQGAAIYPVGIAGSVFKASNQSINYQSIGRIHDFVVYSANTNSAVQTTLQAYSFVELFGGGFTCWKVDRIKSQGVVCIGTVVWFSGLGYNTSPAFESGFADGCTVADINFEYASQTAYCVAVTQDPGSLSGYGELPHFTMTNCLNATNPGAVDFGSWPSTTYGAVGNQGCLWLNGVLLSDSHIGPFLISNPTVINGANGAVMRNGTIETTYAEYSRSNDLYGTAFSVPTSIANVLLHNVTLKSPRVYYDNSVWTGRAYIFAGQAINCKFVTPVITKVSGAIAATDFFLDFTSGSVMNWIDTFDLTQVVSGVTTTAIYPVPSQLCNFVVNSDIYSNEFNNFRTASNIPFSEPQNSAFTATGSYLLATIPAFSINTNSTVNVSATFITSGNSTGSTISLSNLIEGAGGNSGSAVLTSSDNIATLNFSLSFTGGVDKVMHAANTCSYAFSGNAIIKGANPVVNSPGSLYTLTTFATDSILIYLNVTSLADASVTFVSGQIEILDYPFIN
jgi:hypothetical protein